MEITLGMLLGENGQVCFNLYKNKECIYRIMHLHCS